MLVDEQYMIHRIIGKRYFVAFIGGSLSLVIMIIVTLTLPRWFRYCWWDFGLTHSSTFTSFTNFNGESGINDVYSDACGKMQTLVERNCPHFCGYLLNLEIAGIIMISFSTIALIFYVICAGLHVWSFFKVQFKFKWIWLFIVLPCVFYNFALVLYFSVSGIWGYHSTTTHRFNTENVGIKEGIWLAIVISPLTVGLAFLGLMKTKKEFLEIN